MKSSLDSIDIYLLSLFNPVHAEIVECARNAENAARKGDGFARMFWGRRLKIACRKQYK